MTVFVLGAGSTRGCSFVDPTVNPCLPPLDGDFFTQLQRVANSKHEPLARTVIEHVVDLFGHNFHATLETVYTTLEHTIRMLSVTGDNRAYKRVDLSQRREQLKQAIAVLLEESLTEKGLGGSSRLSPRLCDYHVHLVRNVLQPRDVLISFNYDCVIDYALKEAGSGKWNPRYGYGFRLGSRGSRLTGDKHWQPGGLVVGKDETIRLYKLHGSLHFQFSESEAQPRIKLKSRPYTKQHGNLKFTIIPPAWHKSYDQGAFGHLWKGAADAINRATSIVFVGYSLPETDLHSTALFRTTVSKLRSLVVVNPDPSARYRTRSVLQSGITKSTKVLSFDYLREFLNCPRPSWEGW